MQSNLGIGRIVGPVPYTQSGGKLANLPQGPCLVESIDDQRVEFIWGTNGQSSTALTVHELEAAISSGYLVLLGADEQ